MLCAEHWTGRDYITSSWLRGYGSDGTICRVITTPYYGASSFVGIPSYVSVFRGNRIPSSKEKWILSSAETEHGIPVFRSPRNFFDMEFHFQNFHGIQHFCLPFPRNMEFPPSMETEDGNSFFHISNFKIHIIINQ